MPTKLIISGTIVPYIQDCTDFEIHRSFHLNYLKLYLHFTVITPHTVMPLQPCLREPNFRMVYAVLNYCLAQQVVYRHTKSYFRLHFSPWSMFPFAPFVAFCKPLSSPLLLLLDFPFFFFLLFSNDSKIFFTSEDPSYTWNLRLGKLGVEIVSDLIRGLCLEQGWGCSSDARPSTSFCNTDLEGV